MNALRGLAIVIISLVMIPAGFGLLGCTLCGFGGGWQMAIWLVGIAALCLGILVGGYFAISKLSKDMSRG